ncbi:MAG TPA: hypothetical protein VGK88_01005 [bacterium]|jgi:hypothetical protein
MKNTPLATLGNVEVSRFETATGPRLRLRNAGAIPMEAYLDPLELEGLTRVRYKPIRLLPGGPSDREDRRIRLALHSSGASSAGASGTSIQPLQNEFAMVGVAVAAGNGEPGLLIRDMNAGQSVLLSPGELEALLRARHMDFAPLIDTSDLVAIPEPDLDEE